MLNTVEFIATKRDGGRHSGADLRAFISGVTSSEIPEYQTAAWLMAVRIRGMSPAETLDLTLAMRDSGRVLVRAARTGAFPTLDKHSTGGVGDKTTLVVLPMLAAAGIRLLKMSGRGLGFSGGTIDKLESIPGFRTGLSLDEAEAQVERIGGALVAQSHEVAPADGILYALRDVTATVDCLPLIASSIMSKKLAAGAERIVLDVKVGRGAFMTTEAEGRELASELIRLGEAAGVPTMALLSRMDAPLGIAVGNSLEVEEALNVLEGAAEVDPLFRGLCVELAAHSLVAVGAAEPEKASARAEELLRSGAAAAKWAEIVAAQGGPADLAAVRAGLPRAPVVHRLLAPAAGSIRAIAADVVGRLAVDVGAGRKRKGEAIDPSVGFRLLARPGESVEAGGPLADLHLREADSSRAEELADALLGAYEFVAPGEHVPAIPTLVIGELAGGVRESAAR